MPGLSAPLEEIERLLHAGHSDLAVHRATGVARCTAARHRKRLGLPGYLMTEDSPECRHGHPFPENRGFYANGWLYCLACSRARGRRAAGYRAVEPDEMAIERAVAGDAPDRLTPRERAAAVRLLDRRGLSAVEIAERVLCSPRNVYYLRSTFRRAA
jgi:DNA-binding CsgD family transcriptional regulator